MKVKWHHFRYLFTELQRPLDLDITHDELTDFDQRFRLILRKHLVILCWWSLFNIAGGILAVFFLTGIAYYFWMMGMIWGLINFIIVMAILEHTFYRKFRRGAFERFEIQRHVEKLMFLNIGIDSAYIFVGLFLREHSFACEVVHANLWLGFGWSVIIQGLFLLIQDIIVYRLHRKNFKKAQPFLEQGLVK
ncbi:MAG: DUF6992 family protein [Saprospiraceae bacterium]